MLDRGQRKLYKVCPVCERPFVWRKKRAKNRDDIRYCSKKCKQSSQ
ncbi:DUF2256 domain-containing protein [bacterium]|nr:DUF2256 domain-containing protein [bacterium]